MMRFLLVSLFFGFATSALAQEVTPVLDAIPPQAEEDLWDPFDPNINQVLEQMDEDYQEQTGQSPFLFDLFDSGTSCVRAECAVWIQVVKSSQRAYLYLHGRHAATWLVSTGVEGRSTPNFDKHPDGRIYDRYSSKKFPGGDYQGLGNMPYAVFISGGFAIHGTPEGNWKYLGQRASHGCIRVHPENGAYFNRLVRQYGVRNVWVTVQ